MSTDSEKKDTNPKDAVGTGKVPFSTVPSRVFAEVGLAMLEGARKYGRHNYRAVGVRASVYFDASLRHMTAWWEGQDIDPESKLSHVTKAIAGLTVLRDSMLQGNWTDDRPPSVADGWVEDLNTKAKEIIAKYPDAVPAYVRTSAPATHSPVQADSSSIGFGHTCAFSKSEPGYFCSRAKGHEGPCAAHRTRHG